MPSGTAFVDMNVQDPPTHTTDVGARRRIFRVASPPTSIDIADEVRVLHVPLPRLRASCFPVHVEIPLKAGVHLVGVACGQEFTIACDSSGRLWSWGKSREGAMGAQSNGNVRLPELVPLENFKLRSRFERSARVAAARGEVHSTHESQSSGSGSASDSTTHVHCDKFVVGVSCGPNSSLAWTSSGKLFGAGSNRRGELGIGSDARRVPHFDEVAIPSCEASADDFAVLSASMGRSHAACTTRDGSLFTWGSNRDGVLVFATNDGRDLATLTPHRVEFDAMTRIVRVACGVSHTMALTSDGRLFAWGSRTSGAVPQFCHGSADVTASACPDDTVARSAHGTITGSVGRQAKPWHVLGGPNSGLIVTAIATASHHSAAVTRCGRLFVWGSTSSARPRLGMPAWLRSSINPDDLDAVQAVQTIETTTPASNEQCGARVVRPVELLLRCTGIHQTCNNEEMHAVGTTQPSKPVHVLSVSCGADALAVEWIS